jgi:hypothetical protein
MSAHTSKRIAEVAGDIIDTFGITHSEVRYFVLNNAYANDTAVTKLAQRFVLAWHLSSEATCDLHLSCNSLSLAYTSWLCI